MGHHAVKPLIAFYVEQHNTVMPHSAFDGATPDEMFFGGPDAVAQGLAEKRSELGPQLLPAGWLAASREAPVREADLI